MTVEIVIDPNVRVEGQRTYAGFEDIIGGFIYDLRVGDQVTVMEEESDVVGAATIYEIDVDRQLVYLTVEWESLHQRTLAERVAARSRFIPLVRASYLTSAGIRSLDSQLSTMPRMPGELVDADL
jgi:hypothetical protein